MIATRFTTVTFGRGREMLGDRVRELREARGWSQYDLAVKSGLSPAGVWKIENGRTAAPSIATVQRLADALGVTPTRLTDGVQSALSEAQAEEQLIRQIALKYGGPDVDFRQFAEVVELYFGGDDQDREDTQEVLRLWRRMRQRRSQRREQETAEG